MTADAQAGTGHRADWRFLLPPGSRCHLCIAESHNSPPDESAAHRYEFLEIDGWVELVTATPEAEAPALRPIPSVPEPRADVLLVELDADASDALAGAAQHAAAIVELGRSPITRRRRLRALRNEGFDVVGLYLVTPELAQPKRYVPLNRPQATAWLFAGPPKIDRASHSAVRRARRKAKALSIMVAAKALSLLAASSLTEAIAGAGTEGLAIAIRGPGKTEWLPPVLMTSGHDEGSRAVLVDLAGGSTTPSTVTKISSRPRYNDNIANEVSAIRSVRKIVGGTAALARLPDVLDWIDDDDLLLHRSIEAYAGRWTAADLCHRLPRSRTQVLEMVLDAIDEFSIATSSDRATWSEDLFEEYLGRLFTSYRTLPGGRPDLDPLEAALLERSAVMSGRSIPLVQRHYDLGPWNVVIDDAGKQLTIIDWELAPPRSLNQTGFGGADQLYFVKYWLHAAMETKSLNEEQGAFEFLPSAASVTAANALRKSLVRLELDPGFVPLIAGHLWLESALYTAARQADTGGDPGGAARYLETLDNRSSELLDFWRPHIAPDTHLVERSR